MTVQIPGFYFNMAYGLGVYWGDILDREKELNDIDYTFPDGYTGSGESSGLDSYEGFSVWIDFMPFMPFDTDSGSTFRIGFRAQYDYIRYTQQITITEYYLIWGTKDKKSWEEDLIKLYSFTLGPVLQFALFQDLINSDAWIMNLFTQAGPIQGILRPTPVKQKLGLVQKESSDVKGIRWISGLGVETPEFHHLHIGLNLHYAYNSFSMKPNYYTDHPSRTKTHEIGFDLYIGMTSFNADIESNKSDNNALNKVPALPGNGNSNGNR